MNVPTPPPSPAPLVLPVLADYAEFMNALPGGFVRVLGLRFLTATADEVTAETTIDETHLQPYGIVHGGVHAGIVESVGSVGGALQALPEGRYVVGVENRTRFVRPVRGGTRLRAIGRPQPQVTSILGENLVWRVDITDDDGRLVASGQVQLHRLAPGTALAGREVGVATVDVGIGNE